MLPENHKSIIHQKQNTMKTKIFAYKDVLGIEAPEDIEPQLSFTDRGITPYTMVRLEDTEFSQEAVDLLKTFPTIEKGAGNFFLFIDKKGKKSIVWGGANKSAIKKEDIVVIAKFDYSELTMAEFDVPQDFKDFVDKVAE